MASQAAGNKSSVAAGGWRRSDTLPLVVALQGLGLFVLAFLLGAPPSTDQVAGDTAGFAGLADSQSVRMTSDSQVPADLLPEQIRLPRFPNLDERAPRQQPAPISEDEQEASNPGLNLTALRVDTVAFDAPAAVQVALALPDAPEELIPGAISQARFGDGKGRPGKRGREGGWGGIGVTGIGRGGGGACGRGGSQGSPIIIERSFGYPFNQ
jgi:hypothetical protein